MSEPELKPCPFCGGEAEPMYKQELIGRSVEVGCNACDVWTCGYQSSAIEDAAKSWNTRMSEWQPISTGPKDGTRMFPMQKGPPIPWETAEVIYAMYSARYGTSQSLERLAERSGFGWAEVELLFTDEIAKRNYTPIRTKLMTQPRGPFLPLPLPPQEDT